LRRIDLLRVHIATSCAELAALRPRWETCLAERPGTLFQSFEWNWLAAKVFAEREAPYVVYAESDCGLAIIPACIRTSSRTLSLLGEELFDYRDYLSAGDHGPLRAAWQKLAELELPFAVTALRDREASERWSWLSPEPFCGAPMATPSQAPDPKDMDALRRLLRRGATVQQHSPHDATLVRRIYEQKAAQRWPNLFSDQLRRDFMEAAIQQPSSCCEIFTLELDGEELATLVTFLDGNVRRFYTTFFDYRWAKLSPGFSLLCAVADLTAKSGLAYDLMTGEQSHKTRLASHSVPLYKIPLRALDAAICEARASTLAA
jgi:CelD/BcsL family acetyltransferase involved in cellulose biosynthesis